jgi:hypothetical protein
MADMKNTSNSNEEIIDCDFMDSQSDSSGFKPVENLDSTLDSPLFFEEGESNVESNQNPLVSMDSRNGFKNLTPRGAIVESKEDSRLDSTGFTPGDWVMKKNNRGWVGEVTSAPQDGFAEVLWDNTKHSVREPVENLLRYQQR